MAALSESRQGGDGAARATIVIAAFNAEATLERAFMSAIEQSVPVETIVVDDASLDGTATLADRLSRGVPGARVLRQPQNAGPAAARNRAIDASSAPWIAVLDADDHMAPDRIARLLDEAEREGIDLLADDLYRVREDRLHATEDRLWSRQDFGHIDVSLAEFVTANLHGARGQRGEMGFIKPLMRRQFLQEHGLRYDEGMRLGEDYFLYAQALAAGARLRLVDPKGYFAVQRSGSLSAAHRTEDLGALLAADQALLQHPKIARAARLALRRHSMQTRKEWAWRRLIDAVKARDLPAMAAMWREPPAVFASLAGKLGEQAWLRGCHRLGFGAGPRRQG
ncbi:glycosyltransferase family 2 protein [Salipiger sp. PrR002]|uniref:glycosyltransferase family 2 protein n=1 Tax=Salipiger sp. PrR002 TaxID=2706489 RepID=UPI0013B5FD01|nr:glycosyltransferase family 2 protein [Salipiger sp. PrR002]NDW01856.1 glycosyltransferase family 2 protein [Salipiger sp. PrR002]NDW57848.1 glycosyltransferase family 2 protein [Salipiger sp. PrR004]